MRLQTVNYAPADGRSHYNPEAARRIRPINNLLIRATNRREIEGLENLPKDGAHLLCPTHQNYFDAPLVASLSDRDWRFMAAKEQFSGIIGKAMADMGAFPVDRTRPGTQPLKTAVDLLNEGKGVGIFPEGGIFQDGEVHKPKKGTSWIALHSKCESIVPVGIDYLPHHAGVGEKAAMYAAAGAVTAGGLAAAMAGSPVVRVVAGLATGALAGALVGGATGFLRKEGNDVKEKGLAGARLAGYGALLGAAVGGAAGGLLGNYAIWAGAPLSVGAGLTTLAVASHISERPHARVVIGTPLPVEPYRQLPRHEAEEALNQDLHQAMIAAKQRASQPA